MRQDTDLLWIRSAAPDSGDTSVLAATARSPILELDTGKTRRQVPGAGAAHHRRIGASLLMACADTSYRSLRECERFRDDGHHG